MPSCKNQKMTSNFRCHEEHWAVLQRTLDNIQQCHTHIHWEHVLLCQDTGLLFDHLGMWNNIDVKRHDRPMTIMRSKSQALKSDLEVFT